MITCQDYCVADPDALETPAMLLFQDMMDHNIRSVCEMVGGGQNLIVHVKTHKKEISRVIVPTLWMCQPRRSYSLCSCSWPGAARRLPYHPSRKW